MVAVNAPKQKTEEVKEEGVKLRASERERGGGDNL